MGLIPAARDTHNCGQARLSGQGRKGKIQCSTWGCVLFLYACELLYELRSVILVSVENISTCAYNFLVAIEFIVSYLVEMRINDMVIGLTWVQVKRKKLYLKRIVMSILN